MKNKSLLPIASVILAFGVGAAGSYFFQQTQTAPEGSERAKIETLEHELKLAKTRNDELEAKDLPGRMRRTAKGGVKDLAKMFRDGEKVTPDDILQSSKPLLRDISPLFERMQKMSMDEQVDSMLGKYAREYGLNESQQKELRQMLKAETDSAAKAYMNALTGEKSSVEDINLASRGLDIEKSVDGFMTKTLTGETLDTYQKKRLAEKAAKVQTIADRKIQRLNELVTLDEAQEGKVFQILAKRSPDYDAKMQFGGINNDSATYPTDTREAVLSVLRPEQRTQLEQKEIAKRQEEEQRMNKFGMSLGDKSKVDFIENF